MVEKYFEILVEGTEASVKRRPSKTSQNKQIFVFATCYLLEIPFAKLAKFTRFFSMSSFSEGSHAWQLNLYNDEEVIYRELPDRYIKILCEFRNNNGVEGMPGPSEVEPIFRSRRAIEHVWGSLPVFEFMNTTVGHHLRRVISFTDSGRATDDLAQKEPSKTAHTRRTKKSLRVATEIFEKQERSEVARRSSISPPSLFSYRQDNSRLVEFVDQNLVQIKISQCLVGLAASDISTITMFVWYANSGRGRKSRYKLSGFEKLVLWCLLIRGIDVVQLTDQDAIDFLIFCSAPPRHWCSNLPTSKGTGGGRSSTEWRPFKLMVNDNKMNLRAVRIVEWCSAVFQDLIDMTALGYNPFGEVSKRLGSSRHH